MMNVYPDPHWTQVLSALLVPVVAGFGVYIAFQQARTARNKLKLDLFEKRTAIDHAIMALFSSVMTHGKSIPDDGWKFHLAAVHAASVVNQNNGGRLRD